MPQKGISDGPLRRRFQRRQHALVPHRSFHPQPISARCLCALANPYGYYRRFAFALLRCETHASTFLSSLPSKRLCFPPLSRVSPLRYYGDSDSCTAHPPCRSPRLPRHTFLSFRLQPRWAAWTSLHPPRQRAQRVSDFAMSEQARRSAPAESSSFTYGPTVRLRLLSTSLHSDAVTFGYGAVAYSDTDFHRADVTSSRAHSPPNVFIGGPVRVSPGFPLKACLRANTHRQACGNDRP